MLSFDDGLQSVQNRAETEIAALADSMGAAVRDEQAARNKRQTFVSDAAADAGLSTALVLLSLLVKHDIVRRSHSAIETSGSLIDLHEKETF